MLKTVSRTIQLGCHHQHMRLRTPTSSTYIEMNDRHVLQTRLMKHAVYTVIM